MAMLVAALLLEAISMQLFSVWFALGALAALLSCGFGAPVWVQAPLFVLVTVVSLAAARPLVKRLRKKARPAGEAREGDISP